MANALTQIASRCADLFGHLRPQPRLGEALVRARLISEEDLCTALENQKLKGYRLGYHLVKMGAVSEKVLSGFLAERYHVPALSEDSIPLHAELFDGLDENFLKRHEVLPLHRAGNSLTLAMADPTDALAIEQIERLTGAKVNPVVAPQSAIQKQLAHYFALRQIEARMGGGGDSMAVTRFFTALRDYRFQKVIGTGGFGLVCKCWQISLDRAVAIKSLKPELSASNGMAERFKREGKIIAQLSHPNIIQVFEQGEAQEILYIVMEYFEGQPLDVFCQSKDLVEKISVLIPICDALHYAAQQGVVHRDIKPANILANARGDVKLLDFGVAQRLQSGDARLTQQSMVMGTPKYMAPEAFEGAADTTSLGDIYAMAVIAYELFTGSEYVKRAPQSMRGLNPQIPPMLEQVIQKALEKDMANRLRSFDLLKRALIIARDMLMASQTMISPRGSGGAPTMPTLAAHPTLMEAAPTVTPSRTPCVEERVLRDSDGVRVALLRNDQMQRRMVVKQLRCDQVNETSFAQLADIQHPNIVRVLSKTQSNTITSLITEYLDGGSLADKLQAGAVSARNFTRWAEGIVNALHTAAERGVLHGHLHPRNILFTANGQVKVSDFGVNGPKNTAYGRFGRPEIRDPKEIDRYALGVLFFEMLTGEKYHGSNTFEENFEKVQSDRAIEPLLKAPLGRMWGIARYGEKYRNYTELSDHLRLLREKFHPDASTGASGITGIDRVAPAPPAPKQGNNLIYAMLTVLAIAIITVVIYLLKKT